MKLDFEKEGAYCRCLLYKTVSYVTYILCIMPSAHGRHA